MERVTLKWPLAGALIGALGWFVPDLFIIGAITNDAPLSPKWFLALRIFCPPTIFLRGFWLTLAVNCLLYAVVMFAIRFVFLWYRRIRNVNTGSANS